MSLAIIGDIHGDIGKLEALLGRIPSSRRLIFVGDYINRGRHSKEVIDLLSGLREAADSIFLWGNHEIALVNYIKTGEFSKFARAGGLATLRSYLRDYSGDVHSAFLKVFPTEHRIFFSGLRRFHEEEELLFSHMGIDPDFPLSRTYKSMVTQAHRKLFTSGHSFHKLVVSGHYTQENFRPYVRDRFICLDSGCGIGGSLSCLLFPECEFIST